MQRIRIVEPGWDRYTGILGAVEFKDGVSVEPVAKHEINRIGAALRIEGVESGEQENSGVDILRSWSNRAKVENLPRASEKADETPEKTEKDGESEQKADEKPAHVWTEEELAAIADEKGIAGLREIAEPMGVKGRAIAELIREILNKQAGRTKERIEH